MKTTLQFTLIIIAFVACKTIVDPPDPEIIIPGGKGGKFNITVFPSFQGKGFAGMVYIQYGTKNSSPMVFDYHDSSATMVEPGFTHHAHFFNLKDGFYAIKAICQVNGSRMIGDTVIQIDSMQALSTDYQLTLK